MLVGTAASLVAGDRLSVRIDVGPGDRLVVRSVAAQLVLPCPPGCSTALEVDVEVGAGGCLDWWPDPLVVSPGARHRSSTTLRLGAGAVVGWVDEVVLGGGGRDGGGARGDPAELVTTLRADLEGRPLLRDGLDTTLPGWAGPAVLGDGRYVGSAAVLGPEPPPCLPPPWAAQAGPGALARVVAADLAGRDALARAAAQGRGALGLMGR
jgi:urease accessory protein